MQSDLPMDKVFEMVAGFRMRQPAFGLSDCAVPTSNSFLKGSRRCLRFGDLLSCGKTQRHNQWQRIHLTSVSANTKIQEISTISGIIK